MGTPFPGPLLSPGYPLGILPPIFCLYAALCSCRCFFFLADTKMYAQKCMKEKMNKLPPLTVGKEWTDCLLFGQHAGVS